MMDSRREAIMESNPPTSGNKNERIRKVKVYAFAPENLTCLSFGRITFLAIVSVSANVNAADRCKLHGYELSYSSSPLSNTAV